jgi:arylsulfatase
MPTLLDLANIDHPVKQSSIESNMAKKKNHELLDMQGISIINLMKGKKGIDFDERGFGSELFGIRAYRKGNWKILKLPEFYGTGNWQLYDLDSDPGETKDLAGIFPNILKDLSEKWNIYAGKNGVIEPDKPSLYSLPPTKNKRH